MYKWENTGELREILADGEKYWRIARNTGGWGEIPSYSQKYLKETVMAHIF
ncbi:hypothetical protein [Neobacillus niacini]|uniref:hypothetical protein n=1 Tax=Neobacillus niacini TaxID=86668 RepID=UPI002FFF090C